MTVLPSGYILDAPGAFFADGKNNDAGILNSLLRPGPGFPEYINKNKDHFIEDRGFKDSIMLLNSLGIQVHIPRLLDQGKPQFSTIEANESRKVTLCRWLVEAVNGRFKIKFKFFADDFGCLFA